PISFFFSSRRRHTRSKRDWSSDVCSSDLLRSVREFFERSKNTSHVSSGYSLSRVFDLRDTRREAETDSRIEEVGNVRRMWHGTRSEERRVGKEWRSRGTQ